MDVTRLIAVIRSSYMKPMQPAKINFTLTITVTVERLLITQYVSCTWVHVK